MEQWQNMSNGPWKIVFVLMKRGCWADRDIGSKDLSYLFTVLVVYGRLERGSVNKMPGEKVLIALETGNSGGYGGPPCSINGCWLGCGYGKESGGSFKCEGSVD